MTCTVDECERVALAKGWCQMHYMRVRRYGTTHDPNNPYLRFFDKLDTTEGGCWQWRGNSNWGGYGLFHMHNKLFAAHRVAYEWMVGPIPEGMTIDHLCFNRGCQRPDHMEAVTIQENLRRRDKRLRSAA